jgi:hypothetical protein
MQVPKDAKVVVTCQKGLRSLAAAEQLSKAGYKDLAWVNGGLDNSRPGDIPTRDGQDVRVAGIGGLSALVGWTEVQQENQGKLGGFRGILVAVRLLATVISAPDSSRFLHQCVVSCTDQLLKYGKHFTRT